MDASELLRQWRERRGMTQQQLAAQVDINYTMVHNYERKGMTPRRPVAEKIDAALDAGGSLVRAWGYLVETPDEMQQLRERVTLLEESLLVLAKQVEQYLKQAKR